MLTINKNTTVTKYPIKQNTSGISFKSRLPYDLKAIKLNVGFLDPKALARQFRTYYGTDADFGNNKAVAACCTYTANIFDHLAKRFGLPFNAPPPRIRVYKQEDLVAPIDDSVLGFCLLDSQPVLKGYRDFEARSLFLNNNYDSLDAIEATAKANKNAGWLSSGHFLGTYIHEWTHNIHTDWLYRTFGYDGHCPQVTQ